MRRLLYKPVALTWRQCRSFPYGARAAATPPSAFVNKPHLFNSYLISLLLNLTHTTLVKAEPAANPTVITAFRGIPGLALYVSERASWCDRVAMERMCNSDFECRETVSIRRTARRRPSHLHPQTAPFFFRT